MAQSLCSSSTRSGSRGGSRGFTIVEVVVASFILMVGLAAVAGVVGSTLGNTERSEYMTQAATLATEKLEDLNRYPPSDVSISVPTGNSSGSLTSDDLQDVTLNGVTSAVAYYDEVYNSPAAGALVETYTNFDSMGNTQYNTTTYTPNGTMSAPVTSSSAPSTAGASRTGS